MPPRVLVFQHVNCEHPGIFRDFMAADKIDWTAVELDEGETIPDLDAFDILIAMGGPMDVWEETEHPWLVREKQAIREWIQVADKPFLGFCLGHQLLASALGGEVGPSKVPEIGIHDVQLTVTGRAHPLFAESPDHFDTLQWHSAEVTKAPEGSTILAQSPACAINALAVASCAFGVQYHQEMTPTTVGDWGQIPAYRIALEKALGDGALEILNQDTASRMTEFAAGARRLYDNFMQLADTRMKSA